MSKKYRNIQGTDQKSPQTNYRKDLMSSEDNNNWKNHANFSQCRYEVYETGHIPNIKPQIYSICGQNTFGSQLQTFR